MTAAEAAIPEATDAEVGCALKTFTALFGPYEDLPGVSSLRFEVRCRVGKGRKAPGKPPREWFPLTPEGYAQAALLVADEGRPYDCYVGVLPRVGNTGESEFVAFAQTLWASVDNNEAGPDGAIALIKAARLCGEQPLPPPHLALSSGGGVHCCWFLDELRDVTCVEERHKFSLRIKRLALCIGGTTPGAAAETNATYASYMIRVPGSLNHKATYGEPRKVQLLRLAPDAPVQPLVWWSAHLPPEPISDHEKRMAENRRKYADRQFDGSRSTQMPARAIALINSPAPASKRHDTAVEIAAILFAAGWRRDTAEVALCGFAAKNAWRVEKNEIEFILRHFEKKHPN